MKDESVKLLNTRVHFIFNDNITVELFSSLSVGWIVLGELLNSE